MKLLLQKQRWNTDIASKKEDRCKNNSAKGHRQKIKKCNSAELVERIEQDFSSEIVVVGGVWGALVGVVSLDEGLSCPFEHSSSTNGPHWTFKSHLWLLVVVCIHQWPHRRQQL